MRTSIITVHNLSYRYSTTDGLVLKNINFEIPKGSFFLLVGPSGSGKSTLLMLMRGFHQEFGGSLQGDIRVGRDSVRTTSIAQLGKRVGIVFQNPALQLHQLRVIDEVASAPMYQGLPYSQCQQRAKTLIDTLLGKDFYYRSPNELSAGQQQKVAVAASLSLDADILLLDEPFSFLDNSADVKLLELLVGLNRKGKTIVIATHDISSLLPFATGIGVMNEGKLVMKGLPEKVLYDEKFPSILPPPLFVQIAGKIHSTDAPLSWEGILPHIALKRKTIKSKTRKRGKPKLTLTDVSFKYMGSQKGVKNVSLNIFEGEILGIVGANGSGKTTLAKIILGLVKPQNGWVLLDGEDITAVPTEKRARHIGYVTQDPLDMFFQTTLWDEVAAGPRFLDFPNPKEIARKTLQQVNLWQYKDKHPDSISGGEKSKLALADIIANNTLILLLDEPEFGLDPKSWQEIMHLLIQLKDAGKTIVVITQDMEATLFLCDRIAVMKKGKLMKVDTAVRMHKDTKLLRASGLQPLPFHSLLLHIPDTMTLTKDSFLSLFEPRKK